MFTVGNVLVAPPGLNSSRQDPAEASMAGACGPPSLAPQRTVQTRNIAVVLLDPTPLTRECLAMSLNLCDRGVRVLPAATLQQAMDLAQGNPQPEAVVWNTNTAHPADPRMQDRIRELLGALTHVPLIVLNDHDDTAAALDTFRLGVRGYIPTSLGLSVVLEAVRLVGAGGTFIPPNLLVFLMQGAQVQAAPPPPEPVDLIDDGLGDLTARQIDVLRCMREGKANKIIAHELGMCESTVKVHVRNILKKLGATNRTQAVYFSNQKGSA